MTFASRRVLMPVAGLALLPALVGVPYASTVPTRAPERPGVYVRAAGRLVQLEEVRHSEGFEWSAGPEFDAPAEVVIANHELWPCTDEGLAIFAVDMVGRQPWNGWPSLRPENSARLRRIPGTTRVISGDPHRRPPPAWTANTGRTATVCGLAPAGGAPLPRGRYLVWNGKAEGDSSLRAFAFRVR